MAHCASQQAVTHHQTHGCKSQEGKSSLDRSWQLPGYCWLQANDVMECTVLGFHTTFYHGAWVKEHGADLTSRSHIFFFLRKLFKMHLGKKIPALLFASSVILGKSLLCASVSSTVKWV